MKDPYAILGLDRESPPELLRARYEELRGIYSEGRFAPGDAGNEAARNLSELEEAWVTISERIAAKERTGDGSDLGYIDMLIRDGRYDEAQYKLDALSDRSAEWHYLQSIIYYKREWLSESKVQLETAVSLDPGNGRYRAALDKLNLVIGNPNTNADALNDGIRGQSQQFYEEPPRQAGNTLSNCCLAYCLTSLCCDCVRCCG
ncbi:MAG: hypothetical protein LBH24_03690 [Clostridiales bacterium]|jgi:hypothetical protein|nr:hypothetical protein [Clostridiales bacterium]